jgi:hypothetical protein
MSNKKNKGVNLEQQFADKNKNKNKPKRFKDVAGNMDLDPTTTKARRKQVKKIVKGGIPQEFKQVGVTEPSIEQSMDSYGKIASPENPRDVMPTEGNIKLGRAMNIANQYDTKNMKRATEKEDALNMAGGGGLMKYGHGGRGIGITKKGVKPCKMR